MALPTPFADALKAIPNVEGKRGVLLVDAKAVVGGPATVTAHIVLRFGDTWRVVGTTAWDGRTTDFTVGLTVQATW